MKLTRYKIFSFMLAAVFALTLAGCGGGGGGTADDTTDPGMTTPELTDAEKCVAAGGEYADMTCTTAEELAAAAAEAARIAAEEAAAKVVAATASAATKVKAIGVEAAQTTDAGLGGTDVDTVTMTIERDNDGTTVEIADSGMEGDDDPKFAQMMDLGGGLTMHVRDNGDGEEEVVMVSTDIQAPVATAFAMVHPLDANENDATPPVSQSLEINTANLVMIATDGITATGAGEITLPAAVADDDQTADMDETVAAFETAATFNGGPGTLKCAGAADCTVTLDADGDLTAVGNGWEFTPAEGATVDVADADFLNYGFWLKRTTKDGATTYNEVETFAGSNVEASTGSELDDVEGSATYKGDAVGVYVKNVHKSDGSIDTATSGHFTADASLMVYFGGGDVAVNKQNTVTGSISNFALAGGEENAWAVNLKGGTRDDNQNTFSGDAEGGGATGSFSGTFHGLTPETEADDDGTARVAPGAVVGEFNANFSNGTVAGGFGARKQ